MSTPYMMILYGSETGTAQDTAELIWKHSKRFNLPSNVASMDEYNIENLFAEKLMVFVVATAGQGDTPSNMKNFWKFLLRKSLPVDCLKNLRFSILGLGDSSFEKFNFAAKKLNKRLTQLGATEILEIGLADDQHDLGLDGVFGPWSENLFLSICQMYDIPNKSITSFNNVVERFNVTILNKDNICDTNLKINLYEAEKNQNLLVGSVMENSRTTDSNHFQDVRLIKFSVENVNYKPGDVLYIKANNSDEQLTKFFKVLQDNGVDIDPYTLIKVSQKEIKLPTVLEPVLTLRQIAQQYWDLSFKPKRSTMQTLAEISENELEKEKLIEFTTPEGQEEFFNYISRPRRNILEVLNDFPHTTSKLNINLLFEIFSPIKPRAFSIASSSKQTKNEIHLLVAVVKYKTKLFEPRLGLCSNWLASLKPKDKVAFWIQKGTFMFDYNKPMILVGPGTGLAPFRSLLFEKIQIHQDLRSCILLFGCRFKDKDYHCKEDLKYFDEKFGLNLFCAFSRDQEDKIYVQHLVRKNNKLLWEYLQNDARIYVAGNAKNMPNAVREEFVKLVEKQGEMTEDQASDYIRNLEKTNKYQVETW